MLVLWSVLNTFEQEPKLLSIGLTSKDVLERMGVVLMKIVHSVGRGPVGYVSWYWGGGMLLGISYIPVSL